jgi:CDP-glycerol glycerophosphotransferase
VSIVVPAYNVAPYLGACLASLAEQTFSDLEVVVIDDGSTDESAEIAARFASDDGRFRLVRQANQGLGAARNAALGHAGGEFITFVDADDVVPRRAYEVMVGALDRTGSDFAAGGVRRLSSLGTSRAEILGNVFDRERLKTHITRFPELVVDRLTCNKLWRRSFWDLHDLRFPEGVAYEDIWVTIPAHYLAHSVDVLRETVYLWRRREGGDLSLTQRQNRSAALEDRVRAVEHVSRFLADRKLDAGKLQYDRSVLGNDLRYFLDILETADDEFRRLFLDRANGFLHRADDPRVLDQPLAIERLKWELVRRRALPELLEVLRFQAESLAETPPIRLADAWYGDYPFREDPRLGLSPAVCRLDAELAPVVRIERVELDDGTLRLEGYAYIELIGAPEPGSQAVQLVARPEGGGQRIPLRAEAVHRPDVTADSPQQVASLDWSGFVATIEPRELRSGGLLRRARRALTGTGEAWTIGAVLRAGGVERRAWDLQTAPLHPVSGVQRQHGGTLLRAGPSGGGRLEVRLDRGAAVVRSCVLESDELLLEGDVGRLKGGALVLSLKPRGGGPALRYPAKGGRGRGTFAARIQVEDLAREVARLETVGEHEAAVTWDVSLAGKLGRRRLVLPEDTHGASLAAGELEIAVDGGRQGNLRIVAGAARPVITSAAWSPGGVLRLEGRFLGPPGDYELVVAGRREGEGVAVALRHDVPAGRFVAELGLGAIPTPAGAAPLAEARWELLARPRGESAQAVRVLLDHDLLDRLPLSAVVGRTQMRLGAAGYDLALLDVGPDLDPDERGGFRQRRLQRELYPARRGQRIKDVVLYECFGGREYSDSPRMIHEELIARGAPFEHLWVVRDGAFTPPETAAAVAERSTEYYEAYAQARYVVANDHWPLWASRRPEQTWVQTWHGPPLKRLGRDLSLSLKAAREYRRTVSQPAENWHFLVSPGPFATPVLRRAFSETAQVIETGLPRTDLLLRPDRERRALEVKRRLGVPTGKRVVLYAPTYRDHLSSGDRYRQGPLLDLRAVGEALGEEYALLFRRHRLMVGLPTAPGVLDVSLFPDATELLLAVDVLVTDYSSAVFDFATTGRPLIFFTPDLEVYRDQVRGFSIDFEADAPGPLLRDAGDVLDALRDPEGVRAAYDDRYERFVARYCALADGEASSRVVERVFAW